MGTTLNSYSMLLSTSTKPFRKTTLTSHTSSRRCTFPAASFPRASTARPFLQHSARGATTRQVVAMAATGAVEVGQPAPDFELLAGGFQPVKLSDYKGKKVVLAFFPCCFSGAVDDGCQCQLESLRSLTDAGVAVLGISRDQPFAQKAWMEKLGNPSLLTLSDFTMATAEAYVGTFNFGEFLDGVGVSKGLSGYVTSNRGTVAIDEAGNVVYKWVALDDAGKSHPGFLPDLGEVKKALGL